MTHENKQSRIQCDISIAQRKILFGQMVITTGSNFSRCFTVYSNQNLSTLKVVFKVSYLFLNDAFEYRNKK